MGDFHRERCKTDSCNWGIGFMLSEAVLAVLSLFDSLIGHAFGFDNFIWPQVYHSCHEC